MNKNEMNKLLKEFKEYCENHEEFSNIPQTFKNFVIWCDDRPWEMERYR